MSILMAEPEDTGTWTDKDWDDYSAMQEVINDLMVALMADPNFV